MVSGWTTANSDPKTTRERNLRLSIGLRFLITVDRGPADLTGIQPQDMQIAVGRQAVSTLGQVGHCSMNFKSVCSNRCPCVVWTTAVLPGMTVSSQPARKIDHYFTESGQPESANRV